MDNPAGLPEGVGGCRRDGSLFPPIGRRHGSMGGRQVSETPKALQVPPMRESRPAGTAGGTVAAHAGIRSQAVVAGPESSNGLVPPTRPGLQGASSAAPRSTEQAADFLSTSRRLRNLRRCCRQLRRPDAVKHIDKTLKNARRRIETQLNTLGGDRNELQRRPRGTTSAEQAYRSLLDMAHRAREADRREKSDEIGETLATFDRCVNSEIQKLIEAHGLTDISSSPEAPALPTAATTAMATTAVAAATPLQAATTGNFDWIGAIRQVQRVCDYFRHTGAVGALGEAEATRAILRDMVRRRFTSLRGNGWMPPMTFPHACTRPERYYHLIEAMYREAWDSGDTRRAGKIFRQLTNIHNRTETVLRDLTRKIGPLENLSIQTVVPGRSPPMTDAAVQVPASTLGQGPGTLPPAVPGAAGLQALTSEKRPDSASSAQGKQQPPATTAAAVTAPAFQATAATPGPTNWVESYRLIRDLTGHCPVFGWDVVVGDVCAAEKRIADVVNRLFNGFCRGLEPRPAHEHQQASTAERQYRALEDLLQQTNAEGETWRHENVDLALHAIHQLTLMELQTLRNKYGLPDALESGAETAGQQPFAAIGPASGVAAPGPVGADPRWIDWSRELLQETRDVAAAEEAGSFLSAIGY